MGGKSEKEYIWVYIERDIGVCVCVCVSESLCCTPETNTTLCKSTTIKKIN